MAGDLGIWWAFDCDFYGFDLIKHNTSGEECGKKCAYNVKCTHFTYNQDTQRCYLKSGLPDGAKPYCNVEAYSTVCGWKGTPVNKSTCINDFIQGSNWMRLADGVWYRGYCDYPGRNFGSATSATTPNECAEICVATRGCDH